MLYVYNPVENLGTWHEFPGDMYNDADLQVVRDWKKANGVESKVRDEMYIQSMIKANHLDANAIVKHGTEEPTQEVIIESIKTKHPDLKIDFKISSNENIVMVKVQNTSVPLRDRKFCLIWLTPDNDNHYGWMVSDIEQKLIIRVTTCKGMGQKHISFTHGMMDKTDPQNLERCIRLAIKLLEQI